MSKNQSKSNFWEVPADISNKLLESALNTPSAIWLQNLTIYNCPTCTKDTIFKDGCSECIDKEDMNDITTINQR